jgi:hypothetical protein
MARFVPAEEWTGFPAIPPALYFAMFRGPYVALYTDCSVGVDRPHRCALNPRRCTPAHDAKICVTVCVMWLCTQLSFPRRSRGFALLLLCYAQSPRAAGFVVLDGSAEVSGGDRDGTFRVRTRSGTYGFATDVPADAIKWRIGARCGLSCVVR